MSKVKFAKTKNNAKWFAKRWVLSILPIVAISLNLGGCAKKDIVRVAISEEPQVQIIGYMFCQLAKEKDIECEVRETQSGIANIHPALENDSLQVGVEYTQSAWSNILQNRTAYKPNDLTALQREYEKRNLYWCNLPRVEDTYSLAIGNDMAMDYDIVTLSDLAAISDSLVIGAPTAFFEEEDGYPLISDKYDMHFKTTVNIPESGVAQAILDGKVDVVSAHSLDGGIRAAGLLVLEDDLNARNEATAGIVVNRSAMMDHPQLNVVAQEIGRILTSEQLAEFSQGIKLNLYTAKQAANYLLMENGLLEE